MMSTCGKISGDKGTFMVDQLKELSSEDRKKKSRSHSRSQAKSKMLQSSRLAVLVCLVIVLAGHTAEAEGIDERQAGELVSLEAQDGDGQGVRI